jgi:DNA-binding CsgD family transcriptional regulator
MGEQAVRLCAETPKPGTPFSREDYIRCIESLGRRWGWECSLKEATADAVTFRIPVCPFGARANSDPSVCLVESGILGGIAGNRFGPSKVTIHRGEGAPPGQCEIVVYLGRTKRSLAVNGAVYPEALGSPEELIPETEREPSLAKLSQRERQILRLVGEGLSNKDIASALRLSVRTVEGHINRLRSKLTVRGRTDLIRLALRSKLASL